MSYNVFSQLQIFARQTYPIYTTAMHYILNPPPQMITQPPNKLQADRPQIVKMLEEDLCMYY